MVYNDVWSNWKLTCQSDPTTTLTIFPANVFEGGAADAADRRGEDEEEQEEEEGELGRELPGEEEESARSERQELHRVPTQGLSQGERVRVVVFSLFLAVNVISRRNGSSCCV